MTNEKIERLRFVEQDPFEGTFMQFDMQGGKYVRLEDVEDLRAENERLRALLKALEWSADDGGSYRDFCPVCYGMNPLRHHGAKGHTLYCELAAAIGEDPQALPALTPPTP